MNTPSDIPPIGSLTNLKKSLGFGLGLRHVHFEHILSHWPKLDWFEAISENFMDSGGRPIHVLEQIAEHYPIVLHGVSMSIGSTDPLNFDYLSKLKNLTQKVNAKWVSDHLCWTGILGGNSHDLLPLPLTDGSLKHVVARVKTVQDVLERPLILENPSTYLQFTQSTLSEPEFLRILGDETGCGFLLDVNNVYVSCFNAGEDPFEYLAQFPIDRVVQIHLAGHDAQKTHIIDTHDRPVCDDVWALYKWVVSSHGQISTLLEWDGNIPDFETCRAEVLKAKTILDTEIIRTQSSYDIKPVESISTPVDFLVPKVMADTNFIRPQSEAEPS